jgi:hypothetical protein
MGPEFLLTSLVVVLIPGIGVMYTVSTGLAHRWKASLVAAIGCTAGILPHLTAGVLGLSAVLHMSTHAFQVLKLAGTLYLLYLAWGMWRDTGTLKLDASIPKMSAFPDCVKGSLSKPPQSKTDHVLLRFPAPIRSLGFSLPHFADGPPGCCVYGDDLGHLRALWNLSQLGQYLSGPFPESQSVDTAFVCSHIRHPGSPAGFK